MSPYARLVSKWEDMFDILSYASKLAKRNGRNARTERAKRN